VAANLMKSRSFATRAKSRSLDSVGLALIEGGKGTGVAARLLQALRFKDRRPTPLYYYRELQNLRDPLHFRAQST